MAFCYVICITMGNYSLGSSAYGSIEIAPVFPDVPAFPTAPEAPGLPDLPEQPFEREPAPD